MRRTKQILAAILCLTLAAALVACGGGTGGTGGAGTTGESGEAGEATVTLRLFSAWPEGNSNLLGMEEFVQDVYDKTNGTVIIEWGGGPEAIPANQLAEAIMNGVVDVAWTAHTFNVSHMPVLEALKLIDAPVLREGGGFAFVDELYQEYLNARYLGSPSDGLTFSLYLQRRIDSIDDFRGMTIRATPAYAAFIDALGAGQVNMAAGETYQALERGVIQGTGWPSLGIADFGWHEVVDYIIKPAFYNVDVALVVSSQAWDRLSANQQTALQDAALALEQWARSYYSEAILRDNEMLEELGMTIIHLPPDVAEEYLDLAYSASWASVLEADPVYGERLMRYAGLLD
ncbi:MAG: TRAP transporter substrate-binding protein DctP [Oscillospiraceae bacterium]|nr:TRAP transporter substrate-binding protein DctP [Oscillospiraceae bacterium]